VIRLRPTPFPIALDKPFRAFAVEVLAEGDEGDADVTIPDIPLPPAIARAAPRRIAGFVAGRYCVQALGVSGNLAIGPDGAPVWPPEFVGSITHTERFAAAVVAPRDLADGVGLDCEQIIAADSAPEIGARVCPELATSDPLDVTLAFSAKESLYKCFRPLVGTFFGFDAARITAMSHDRICFAFRGADVEATVAVVGDHVYTFMAHDSQTRRALARP
jgi:enterobactin synthetase component D